MVEQKSKEKKQPNLMKIVLLSTLLFGVILYFVSFIYSIVPVILDKCLRFAELDPLKLYAIFRYCFSLNLLSGLFIMTILPVFVFFIGVAVLSLTLKRRVPLFTAVLSTLIFCFIYQWFWSRALAADPDPLGAAMVFFILSPFLGGFSGIVSFLPMFFVENYFQKVKSKILKKS